MIPVELGGGRRRWWPVVLGAAAVWFVLAAVLGGGGDDAETAPSSTTAITVTTTTVAGTLFDGMPMRLAAAGYVLAFDDGRDLTVLRLRDGSTDVHEATTVVDASTAGLLVTAAGHLSWWPGADAQAAVDVGDGAFGFVSPAADVAWVINDAFGVRRATARALDSGDLVADVVLPEGAASIGTAAGALIIAAGGDALAVAPDGSTRRISDGQPVLAGGDLVVVNRCGEDLECGLVAIDVAAGQQVDLGPAPGRMRLAAGPNPEGRLLVQGDVRGDVVRRSLFLIAIQGIEEIGALPGLPDPIAWTPDGLLVGALGHTIEVHEPGGELLGAFTLPTAPQTLAVVAPGAGG